MTDNVIEFEPVSKAIKEECGLETGFSTKCLHRQRWIDTKLRRVMCKKCGEQLDPIEVLIEISHSMHSYKVPIMEKRLAELERHEKMIKNKQRIDLMTEEEKKMSGLQLQSSHSVNGCPKERMWFKGKMVHCYCGIAFNAESFPVLAEEVREAHERVRVRSQLRLA
jgi:hypothetical protein